MLFGTVLALWSASAGVQHLMQAINTAYDEDETRGFLKVRGPRPAAVGRRHRVPRGRGRADRAACPPPSPTPRLGDPARIAIGVLRWPALAVAMVVALGILYRFGARP